VIAARADVVRLLFLAFTWQDPVARRLGDPGGDGYRLRSGCWLAGSRVPWR
jgi:hypothetical protein